jgi:hypothetical protein
MRMRSDLTESTAGIPTGLNDTCAATTAGGTTRNGTDAAKEAALSTTGKGGMPTAKAGGTLFPPSGRGTRHTGRYGNTAIGKLRGKAQPFAAVTDAPGGVSGRCNKHCAHDDY